jgi:hypothetical protein
VSTRLELVQTKHRAEDVGEFERQMKLLVKDTAKKLQATNEHRESERGRDADAEVGLSK